ncbi:MAG: putative nucleotidyltransferase substrate binding domain-containing protein [Longimonas sp.]|uniref:putative nucleotidyltransferase substrate binding domain-containing protein n=1 Tax=Longimonas sp. TaxID=2039626 RepID=UPI0033520A50
MSTPPVEVTEVLRFVRDTPPFDTLPDAAQRRIAQQIEITYAPEGTVVLPLEADPETLYLIRSGAVELHDDTDRLVARLDTHDFFGYPALLTDAPAQRRATTIEDTLLYQFPADAFDAMRSDHPTVDRFFNRAYADRLRDAIREQQTQQAFTTPIRHLITREPVTVDAGASIRDAARQMAEARVSSIIVVNGETLGIITDRDLRNRVVAEGHDPGAPCHTIMTREPITIQASAYVFEALLAMSRHNVHHLPVVDGEQVAGMVTTTDLMRLEADHPVYLVGDVWKQTSVEGLQAVADRLPQLMQHLVEASAQPADVGRAITTVADAITKRLIELAYDELGQPPIPFAWMALGSQARHEMSIHSDQDNALVLSDDYDRIQHGLYFERLAAFVCDGLDACGFEYCPGDVMATTDRWRQPVSTWRRYFRDWMEEPHPKSLMHASIFFDWRPVAGAVQLGHNLHRFVLNRTPDQSIFLASLTVNALKHTPPLGFFRQFVLERHGGETKTLDLKLNGLVPIVDLARIHALDRGLAPVNTLERLQALGETGSFASSDANDLTDAWSFIASVRMRHQAHQLRKGTPPDSYVAPDALSDFEQRHLKDAFKIARRMQSALDQRYQTHFIR